MTRVSPETKGRGPCLGPSGPSPTNHSGSPAPRDKDGPCGQAQTHVFCYLSEFGPLPSSSPVPAPASLFAPGPGTRRPLGPQSRHPCPSSAPVPAPASLVAPSPGTHLPRLRSRGRPGSRTGTVMDEWHTPELRPTSEVGASGAIHPRVLGVPSSIGPSLPTPVSHTGPDQSPVRTGTGPRDDLGETGGGEGSGSPSGPNLCRNFVPYSTHPPVESVSDPLSSIPRLWRSRFDWE